MAQLKLYGIPSLIVGTCRPINNYGLWSVEITTPSGATYIYSVDRVQFAQEV